MNLRHDHGVMVESRFAVITSSIYSRLPLAQTNIDFPGMDYFHIFSVILPSLTRTLDNFNLPLTRSNFNFPSGHLPYYFTLDNSNHVCQDARSQITGLPGYVCVVPACPYEYSIFFSNCYCKYLCFLKSAFTATYLQ